MRPTFLLLLPLALLLACSEEKNAPDHGSTPGPAPFHFEARSVAFRQVCGRAKGKDSLLETIGSGVVVADFNGDENLDLYLVSGAEYPRGGAASGATNALWFGDGRGGFTEGPKGDPARDRGFGVGAVAADYDRDGDLDLYVCNWGKNVLLRNRGDGRFEDVSAAAGVAGGEWSASASFGDVDGDGLLDLYVANYLEFGSSDSLNVPPREWTGLKVPPGPKGLKPQHDRLYRNRGDGTFVDISASAGLFDEPARYSLAVLMSDLDADGDLDIYVANDSQSNAFWENNGQGRFEDVGLLNGSSMSINGHAQAGMGIAAEDLDNNGVFDLVVTNFIRDYNTLYLGRLDHSYDDRTTASGLASPTFMSLAFGVAAEDFDNDGIFDLFFANGHVYPQVDQNPVESHYAQKDQIFRGLGSGRFEECTRGAGPAFASAEVSRGVIAADLDGDGGQDLVISEVDAAPTILMNRSPSRGHWLVVRLRGKPPGRDLGCVASMVELELSSGRRLRREMRAGGSYASGGPAQLHFGLGGATEVTRLSVKPPRGPTLVFDHLGVDRAITIEVP